MPNYCGQWTRVGTTPTETIIIPIRCRSWACPTCGPRNKRKLLRRMRDAPATTLITLTCNPRSYTSPDSAFRHLSQQLPHLIKRIRRRFPSSGFQYVLIWERTKRGWPHAHLLCRTSFLPQRWVSRAWGDLTGAPIVDVRAISRQDGAVRYVAKYLAKDPQAPDNMKRYRASQAFFLTKGGLLGKATPTGATWSTRYFHWWWVMLDYPFQLYEIKRQPSGAIVCIPRPPPAPAAPASVESPPRLF